MIPAVERASSSHKMLERESWPDFVSAFHDRDGIGPRMLVRMAKRTGVKPDGIQRPKQHMRRGWLG